MERSIPRFLVLHSHDPLWYSIEKVRQASTAVGAFALMIVLSRILARTSAPFPPWTSYLLPLIQLVLSFNIFVALLPLIQRPDDLSDIPLTPSQRALLGLSATNTPLTPGSTYITPPRYQRSTPRSASGSRGTPRSRSPASAAGLRSSSAGRERESHSPFSPNASPFLQKAVGGGFTRRLSYGSQSPLSGGILLESSSGSMTPSTPTPIGGKTTSVPLSSRWLYEKGRGSPGARSLY